MIITCIIVYVVTVLLYLGVLKYCKSVLNDRIADMDNIKMITFIPAMNTLGLFIIVGIMLVYNYKDINNKIVDKLIGEDDEQ